jgi:hypothetical protein
MAELKEGTLKITVTEAALKVLGEQHQVTLRYGKVLLAQCDKCMVWMAQEEIGYRDQLPYVRTECRGCHEHDWRCQEDFGEDDLPEEGAPVGDCPKCGRVMAIPVGGGFECRYHDCRRSS